VLHKKYSTQVTLNNERILDIVWPIILAGAAIGLLLSWSVLTGDESGRVNILYLLVVYLFIPIISIIVSIISMLFGRGINLAKIMSLIPFWSHQKEQILRNIQQLKIDNFWFLMQSQLAAVSFSVVSLMTFLLLLLVTDINFVWRSTVLNAEDIMPWLELIAKPWFFWSSAQPDLELLQLTQDSRLVSNNVAGGVYARWWQFILATQLFYSLLLRLSLFATSRWVLIRRLRTEFENHLQYQQKKENIEPKGVGQKYSFVTDLPNSMVINNWADIPNTLFRQLPMLNFHKDNQIIAGPQATQAQQIIAERWQNQQLVIVKSWEPPLAELQDYLQNGKGYLLPIDWSEDDHGHYTLAKPKKNHLNEWLRMIAKHPQWQVYLPDVLA
jgi:hypothetical protein